MWSERGEEAGNSQRGGKVLWMWREGTQEVGVSKHEEKKVRESGTAVESMEEDKRAQ